MVKRSNQQENPKLLIQQLMEENQGLKAIVSEYTELKRFAEEVVEKHNGLVAEYKTRQTEVQDVKDELRQAQEQIEHKEEQITRQKGIIADLDKKLTDFQNHITRLIERYNETEQENNRLKATVDSLEKYIEIMDVKTKFVRNERGAGRKKKYTQSQIDSVLALKKQERDYDYIARHMDKAHPERTWNVKEIKYIYSRYK